MTFRRVYKHELVGAGHQRNFRTMSAIPALPRAIAMRADPLGLLRWAVSVCPLAYADRTASVGFQLRAVVSTIADLLALSRLRWFRDEVTLRSLVILLKWAALVFLMILEISA